MADKKDTIYVDIDDEITTVIDKVKSSDAKVVALVLPKRAGVFQSIVNMKLLKRAAEADKKNLVLITSEAGLLPLAGAAMIHVAKTPSSKPEIPEGPDMEDSNEPIEADALSEEDINKPVGELAQGTSADEMETLTLPDKDASDDEHLPPKKKDFKPKKDKKLAVPNFDKFRLYLLIGGGTLLVLLIGFLCGTFIFNRATINIQTNAAKVNVDKDLNLSTTARSMDTKTNTLPAKLAQEQKTYTAQATATGQKNTGNKASGSVKMTACSKDASLPSALAAGSGVSSSGQTYITQQTTKFSDTGKSDGSRICYEALSSTAIVAQSGGTAFNGASTFSVPGRSDITASLASAVSGGTDNIVTVVNQTDINTAKSKISPSDSDMRKKLQSKIKSDNYYPINSTYSAGTPNITTSVEAGQPANTVTVTETITYTMFGVRENDINSILEADINKQLDNKSQGILDNGLSTANFTVNNQNNTSAQLSISATASVGPQVNVDDIKQQSLGKKPGEVRAILETNQDITKVDIKLSPFFVSSIPNSDKKVNVVIVKPTLTKSSNGSN
ncbi:MAG: hypothetical protein WCF91_00910 [bacterium]